MLPPPPCRQHNGYHQQPSPNNVSNASGHGLRCGYRHIDAAACCGNESEVGEGIRTSRVPGSDMFFGSKLDPVRWPMPFIKGSGPGGSPADKRGDKHGSCNQCA
ncbi:hypothetical protein F4824DRAFT_444973 [Ustulina deusta]|nr:hypothetical protein F4824DRAFT_444973 [Ustulina deusta]